MRLLQPPQYLIRTPEPFIAFKLENVDRNPPSFGRANSDILPRPNHYGPHTFALRKSTSLYQEWCSKDGMGCRWNGVYNRRAVRLGSITARGVEQQV